VSVHVLARVEIEDFGRFLENFNSRGLRLRRQHGSRGARVFRDRDDPDRVVLLFEWESEGALREFLADPDVREAMKLGGARGPLEVSVLDSVEELPH
jgi:heme-degrading monooxygenase HmoA